MFTSYVFTFYYTFPILFIEKDRVVWYYFRLLNQSVIFCREFCIETNCSSSKTPWKLSAFSKFSEKPKIYKASCENFFHRSLTSPNDSLSRSLRTPGFSSPSTTKKLIENCFRRISRCVISIPQMCRKVKLVIFFCDSQNHSLHNYRLHCIQKARNPQFSNFQNHTSFAQNRFCELHWNPSW